MVPLKNIRNFSIIAHIDHGKSTLADRILEISGVLSEREKRDQYLDRMELERERGITIKAQSVRIPYTGEDGQHYILNLIDTPGHVDFSYEVSRSLAACDGALLVVDASQGVEAQTLANVFMALDNDLEIIPVLNKIDLPSADPERVAHEIEDLIGLDCTDPLLVSAKTGQGVRRVLERIIRDIPPPKGDPTGSAQGPHLRLLVRLLPRRRRPLPHPRGTIRSGQRIQFFSNKKSFESTKLGVFSPDAVEALELGPGEVGFLCAAIKELKDARVGDTITTADNPTTTPFPGFKKVKPMVFCGLYPEEPAEYEPLKNALEKLQLNDAAFSFEPETSQALGFGFRCGFLGLLHMEIIQERLEREFNVRLIATAPSVVYRVTTVSGSCRRHRQPEQAPLPAGDGLDRRAVRPCRGPRP
jgi:GTP-binding protein LepA